MENQLATCHVVYILTKLELGGAQKICLALMDGMSRNHLPATLISGAEGELVGQASTFDSVILLSSLKREVTLFSLLSECKTFFSLIRILRQLKKQHGTIIVHTHSTKAGIMGRWAAFCALIPHRIHTIHGYGFHDHQGYITWFVLYVCELITSLITTHFICVSEHDRTTGMRLFPFFTRKSSLIRAAVDQKKIQGCSVTAYANNNRFIIGTISCFKPQKNLFDLLHAFKTVHQACIAHGGIQPELHIIGDGSMRHDIEAWIRTEQLTDSIVLLGWQKDVIPWLRSWNVFALSSLWEGLPCAVIEARLCHLPVVAYDVGGIREVIFNGKNGFLEKPGDWQGLATRMVELIQQPSLHYTMKNFNDQLDNFDIPTMINQHLELYRNFSSDSL
jgi:glycosyltransferase involved in cell wall biosynthesis